MLIGITGATGFIGRRVIDIALRRGHEIAAFTRDPSHAIPGCAMRAFSTQAPPDVSGCDAFVHVAGEPVAGLWTAAKKRRIRDSRVLGTQRVVEAIAAATQPPEVLVNGSAIGVYGDGEDRELTEDSPRGEGFLADVCYEWEAAALRARRTRVVLLRTSLVLGKGGGFLAPMAPIFRAGLGGPIGDGRQWMSWIHLEDQARLILFAVENMDVSGPLNAAAPWPARNGAFTAALAHAVNRPAFLRVPEVALWPLGEFRRELLDSRRVLPAVATEHGFGFQFPELEPALKNLFG